MIGRAITIESTKDFKIDDLVYMDNKGNLYNERREGRTAIGYIIKPTKIALEMNKEKKKVYSMRGLITQGRAKMSKKKEDRKEVGELMVKLSIDKDQFSADLDGIIKKLKEIKRLFFVIGLGRKSKALLSYLTSLRLGKK